MQDGQDASGLMFRRNRFYDPASGRFTQEDPIGLAGGVNSYGFAEGDPVGYSDPYGLMSCPGSPGCPNDGAAAAQGVVSSAGSQGVQAGSVRRAYEAAVANIDPSNSAARTALKAETRARTPPLPRGYIEMARPGLGPRPGSTGRANVSNAGVNKAASAIETGGTILLVASVAVSVYEIAKSDDGYRETVVQGFGFLGALGGGAGGGAAGSLVAPGPGTIGGSLVGAAFGGAAGQRFGGWVYDRINPR